ncbi:armadillo-type protein [Mycena sp. CBHHK59/15]|nr:armadillo-type protein [Mycena sp. CBHHK59/15]
MLGSIARHESLNSSIVGLHLSAPLVSLLQHKENAVREKAIYALACISKWPGSERGTLATENVSGLYMAMNLLDSPEPDVAKWACWMVGNVVQYEPWNTALVLHLCVPLVSLLAHHGSLVQRQAMYSLGCISEGAEEYARAVVDANVLDHAMGLLQSQDPHMLRWTCWMLGNVARRKSLTASVMALGPCPRLTSLLNHEDVGVNGKAIYALVGISDGSDEGGQAVVDANALDHVFQLLDSPDRDVVKSTCWMLGNIASRQALSAAVVQLYPCARLVSLLEHRDSNVQSFAMYALACISEMSDQGVNAVAEAKALDSDLWPPSCVVSWFSPRRPVAAALLFVVAYEALEVAALQWACWMVGNLAAQKSLNATVIDLDLCGRLVSLLQTSYNDAVRENAIYALACISAPSEDGARAVADAKIQDYCKILLESQDTLILDSTCRVLGNLARHEAWHSAVIELGICPRLVSLSEHNDTIVQDYALYALVCISELSEKGARAVADAGALERAAKLLASPDDRVKAQTCCVLGNIGRQESLNAAVVAIDPCMPLVSLLEHDHSDVRNEALYALACISHSSEQGARAVVDAGALAHIVKLLVSQDICVLRRTCWVLRSLASHESLNAMIIELDSCAVLVSLLQHDNTSVQGDAMEALGSLSDCSERGGRAVAGAHTLDHVGRLLQAQGTAVLYCTCWMLGNLAFNEALHAWCSLWSRVPGLSRCWSEHEHARVRENAMYALACISDHSYSGARAVVAAHALDHALTLLASSDAEVKSETCWMVGNVARYPPLNAAVIDLQPCAQLVELLQHEKSEVRAYAMYALACISNDLGAGAWAVADADTVKALDIDTVDLLDPGESQEHGVFVGVKLRCLGGSVGATAPGDQSAQARDIRSFVLEPAVAERSACRRYECPTSPTGTAGVVRYGCAQIDLPDVSYAAVVESNPCMGLLALGNMNDDSDVRAKVLDILESISAGSPTGAQVVADARLRWELPHDF